MRRRVALLFVATVVATACTSTSHTGASAYRSPSPSTATTPTRLCFTAPPSDWAKAMANVAAALDGVNFGAGAIDEQDGVVYGGAWSGSRSIIASVALSTGTMTAVAPISANGFGWMTYADGWLVWA